MAKSTATVTVRDSTSGRALEARVSRAGEDLVVAVVGGERPHVGSVVLAQPVPSASRPGVTSASCSVLTIPPHKEEIVARTVATALTEAFGCVTVVSAGVHEDGLDREGIETYIGLCERLAAELVARLGDG